MIEVAAISVIGGCWVERRPWLRVGRCGLLGGDGAPLEITALLAVGAVSVD